MQVKNIGTEKALQKIKHYCAYQERSHREVKEKLYSFGLYKHEVEKLLSQLIEEDYLNEERFSIAFAGGRFRLKQWGKVKIKYELKQKGISDYCIKKALASIDDSAYVKTLHKLYDDKLRSIRTERNLYSRKAKIYAYLSQKGYEPYLINNLFQAPGNK